MLAQIHDGKMADEYQQLIRKADTGSQNKYLNQTFHPDHSSYPKLTDTRIDIFQVILRLQWFFLYPILFPSSSVSTQYVKNKIGK
ncbi:hypothetical protein VY86_17365 [Photorhabdus thracensis]|uniref:Uncharacterized protein n=1 Tax=Photorhabdus thracensis TaxID=230089 RepID=A0A0F7LSS0_9GAMM|nr:hypothetical protein VY86_17365 [Photorhabdus thracensis]